MAAADAAESVAPAAAFAHLERAFQLWDAAGAAAAPAERAQRLWQAAEVATTTVGNARAAMLARAAFEAGPPPFGIAWGHERLGRYLWSSGQLDASRREFERAAELLADDDSPSAALVYAGLGQAALMAGEYTTARRWTDRVFELAPNPGHNPAAWVMARRVLGIALSNEGDPESAVELCRQAVGAATNARREPWRPCICASRCSTQDGIPTRSTPPSTPVAEGQLTGLDHGFLCYFDSVAAEALLRLGRWPEADAVLSRNPVPSTLPVGHLRLARAQAMLAARRGDKDVALEPVGRGTCAADGRMAPVGARRGSGRRPPRVGQLGHGTSGGRTRLDSSTHDVGAVGGAIRDVRRRCHGRADPRLPRAT